MAKFLVQPETTSLRISMSAPEAEETSATPVPAAMHRTATQCDFSFTMNLPSPVYSMTWLQLLLRFGVICWVPELIQE